MLAEKGWLVLAGVRKEEDAESLSTISGVQPLLLDVTCPDQVAAAASRADEVAPEGLSALVNNAGLALPAAVELTPPDQLRHLLEVNAIGALQMIQALLPSLRRRPGRIVNVSSMNGTIALPMVGAYSASKFAIEAISDTLRVELRPWGITVSIIRPGQVQTAIFDKARTALEAAADEIPEQLREGYLPLYETAAKFNERGATSAAHPETVARAVHKALTARWPKARYVVGWDARGLQLAKRCIPVRLLDRALARALFRKRPLIDFKVLDKERLRRKSVDRIPRPKIAHHGNQRGRCPTLGLIIQRAHAHHVEAFGNGELNRAVNEIVVRQHVVRPIVIESAVALQQPPAVDQKTHETRQCAANACGKCDLILLREGLGIGQHLVVRHMHLTVLGARPKQRD